ncbi:MAG: biotin-dependent carboxyltransferase, partial [Synergistaceae bacterium]|nr:biotin-dependent carboxyltransferase [Synergistaceae bacterium]
MASTSVGRTERKLNNMGFRVDNPGILTTIQDGGRFGYEKFGVSPSGAMDFISFTQANILADNPNDESALELTIAGATLTFDSECVIAITGADMSPTINGKPCEMYRALKLNPGDVLKLGFVKNLCRSYIAFHGGLDVPQIMASRATAIQNHIGQKLQRGDHIDIRSSDSPVRNFETRAITPTSSLLTPNSIRVILGPQAEAFTDEGIENFLSQPYKVSKDFDRMGYRLEGAKIAHKNDCNIISDGMVTGAIQVPGSGQPIIMMSERQTIGGYTKIAVVITADLPLVGQSKEGDILKFKAVSVKEAHEALREVHKGFDDLRASLDTPRANPNASYYRIKVDGRAFNVSVE